MTAIIQTKLVSNQKLHILERTFKTVKTKRGLEVTDTGKDLEELINRWQLPAAAVIWEE